MSTTKNALVGAVLSTLAACAGGGGATTPAAPKDPGTLRMTVVRSATSQVPAVADSAFVRIWNPGLGTSVVKPVAIPAPGASTTVNFSVPAGSGYSVAVVAFHDIHDLIRVALAGGRTDAVTVTPGAITPVSVAVAPWTYTLAGPDTAQSGQAATYTLSITSGPVTDFFTDQVTVHMKLGSSGADQTFSTVRSGNTATATFTVPTVASDSAIYLGYSFFIDEVAFQSAPSASFAADMPDGLTGAAPLRRPIKAAPTGVTVSFAHRR